MEQIIIRNVTKEDIKDIVDIQIDGWKNTYKGIIDSNYLNTINREEKIQKREKDYMNYGFIVAEINHEIVGFCKYVDNNKHSEEIKEADCELQKIYVKTEFKNKGIGTKLFQFVKNELSQKGKKKMILWCLKDNLNSINFYQKMGGTIISEKFATIGGKQYPEVCIAYDI